MTRRALGRGRLITALGAVIALAGSVPPWWTIGGTVTQAYSGNAFEGSGILVFVAALGLLALVVLPFASEQGESALDRPLSYVVLAVVAIAAFLLRLMEINAIGALALPDRAPGLWLTGAGLAVIAWGCAELLTERSPEG